MKCGILELTFKLLGIVLFCPFFGLKEFVQKKTTFAEWVFIFKGTTRIPSPALPKISQKNLWPPFALMIPKTISFLACT